MADTTYDVLVVGGGPGGYVTALRAAQLGLATAVVEKRETLGGTCLNVGCIPSKALLDSSELYAQTRDGLAEHGIAVDSAKLDLETMQRRKQGVVHKMVGGLAGLMEGRRVTVITGTAELTGANTVRVTAGDGSTSELTAGSIVLATGSVPVELPFLEFDGESVVSSTDALEFTKVPKELVVVGAGAIGLELGSVWRRLGSHVTVVEIMKDILPGWDEQVSKTLRRELTKQGFEFKLGHKVTGVTGSKGKKKVALEGPNDAKSTIPADKVLVAVGRRPAWEGLGIEALGIETDEKTRRIVVDDRFRTSVSNIYAIGDLIPGPMLAHKAEDEGMAVAEIIAGKPGHVNYETIPGVVYTWPEAASVGLSEERLKEAGTAYRRGSFAFGANGRALSMSAGFGFAKILADEKTDRILGAHIVGPWASDLISEIVTAMEFGGSAEDIARTVHAHPTLTEVVREAALAVDRRAIHSL